MKTEPNDPAKKGTEAESNKTEEAEVRKRQKKPRVRRFIVLTTFFGLFFGLTQVFESLNHKIPFLPVLFLALSILFAALGLRIHLLNNGAKNKNANCWAACVIIPGLALCVFLFWWERPQPTQSHLRLFLSKPSGTFLQPQLDLTNEFLIFRSNTPMLSNIHGVLMIPVFPSSTNVALRFGVRNWSTTETEEFASIGVYLIHGVPFFTTTRGWVPCGQDKTWDVICHVFPFPFLPTDTQSVPEINFAIPQALNEAWPMRIELTGKSCPRFTTACWVRFVLTVDFNAEPKLFFVKRVELTPRHTIIFAPE